MKAKETKKSIGQASNYVIGFRRRHGRGKGKIFKGQTFVRSSIFMLGFRKKAAMLKYRHRVNITEIRAHSLRDIIYSGNNFKTDNVDFN